MQVLRRYGLLFAGLLLLLVGGIVLVVGVGNYVAQPAGFGWTAYAPLESASFYAPPAMSLVVAGVVLMVLGLASAAVWFVLWLNRNRSA